MISLFSARLSVPGLAASLLLAAGCSEPMVGRPAENGTAVAARPAPVIDRGQKQFVWVETQAG